MRLSQQSISKIDQRIRLLIALALGLSDQAIYKSISENKSNSILTKYAALEVIMDNTGLTIEQILVRDQKVKPDDKHKRKQPQLQ